MKHTKIVCTIGPASESPAMLAKLITAGMDVARLNFSHGDYAEHGKKIRSIRAVARRLGKPVAILQDLQGPKIRTGAMPQDGVTLVPGKHYIFSTALSSYDGKRIPVQYKRFADDVRPGQRILMDDGLLEVEVVSVRGSEVTCTAVIGGALKSHKGINMPDTKVSISAITSKDKRDLVFGIKSGVDFVALSFVRTAKEVRQLKAMIKRLERTEDHARRTRVIVKVEKKEAVDNIDDIIAAADGIMVARGDLGVEMRAEQVPVIQKMIIEKCVRAAKPVIVATQMLDSMIRNPRPTRAEVSDVANAVIDSADAVMLSGESAFGAYPLESVQTMTRIIQETESSRFDDQPFKGYEHLSPIDEAFSSVAASLARKRYATLIIVPTMTGKVARIVSHYRPELPIAAVTTSEKVQRQLNLQWGVRPFLAQRFNDIEALQRGAVDLLKRQKLLKKGDHVIIIAGQPVGQAGVVNWVKVHAV